MLPISDDNPTERQPFIIWCLVIANVAGFLWQLHVGLEYSVRHYGFVPAHLGDAPRVEGLHILSSMFMHGGWLHLLGNLWFLSIFGDNVEDEMGHVRFLIFYLFCGIGADLAHYYAQSSSTVPTVGASGAISGVLGAYMVRHPMAKVRTWTGYWIAPFVELPAFVFLGVWAGMQFLSAMLDRSGQGGVAYWAHLGGLIAGVVLLFFFTPDRPPPRKQNEW